MSNYLQLGADVLHSRMCDYAGVKIKYRRVRNGVLQQKVFIAVPGRVQTEQTVEATGAVMREVARDFIVRRIHLTDFDPPAPQRNDDIIQDVDGEEWIFKVSGEGSFISHYEEADSYGIAWRIHTKRDRYA